MSESPAPAGWYADPQMANTQRYWDGSSWTDHRAPLTQAATSPGPGPAANGVITFGVLCAIFLPIVGFIIGLTQINKRGSDGLVVVVISVISGFLWLYGLTH